MESSKVLHSGRLLALSINIRLGMKLMAVENTSFLRCSNSYCGNKIIVQVPGVMVVCKVLQLNHIIVVEVRPLGSLKLESGNARCCVNSMHQALIQYCKTFLG